MQLHNQWNWIQMAFDAAFKFLTYGETGVLFSEKISISVFRVQLVE